MAAIVSGTEAANAKDIFRRALALSTLASFRSQAIKLGANRRGEFAGLAFSLLDKARDQFISGTPSGKSE